MHAGSTHILQLASLCMLQWAELRQDQADACMWHVGRQAGLSHKLLVYATLFVQLVDQAYVAAGCIPVLCKPRKTNRAPLCAQLCYMHAAADVTEAFHSTLVSGVHGTSLLVSMGQKAWARSL